MAVDIGVWNKLILCDKIYDFTRFSQGSREMPALSGQAGNLFEQVTHQKATELENVHSTNLEKVTNTSHHTEPSTLPLEINIVKKY